jgi:hypothetical protein
MDVKQTQSELLLNKIRANLAEIESLYKNFISFEEDYIYRFYHQSFKVFGAVEEIKTARILFEKIAPDGIKINNWYSQIIDEAIGKDFDWEKTNADWLNETRPILEAFWHSKYFLEQMISCANDLDESPQILPSGWAAVLYLYNLR